MSEVRSGCEGDQATMGCWISHCNEQENTEREIDAHHHRVARVRMCRIQYATDGRVNGNRKEQPHQHQHNLQRSFSKHSAPLLLHPERTLIMSEIAILQQRSEFSTD